MQRIWRNIFWSAIITFLGNCSSDHYGMIFLSNSVAALRVVSPFIDTFHIQSPFPCKISWIRQAWDFAFLLFPDTFRIKSPCSICIPQWTAINQCFWYYLALRSLNIKIQTYFDWVRYCQHCQQWGQRWQGTAFAILVIFIVLIGELVTFCLIKSPILKTLRAGANKGKVGCAKQCSNQIKHFNVINFSSYFLMCKVTNKSM